MEHAAVVALLEKLAALVESAEKAPGLTVDYEAAAKLLGFKSSKTISRMVKSGAISAVKLSGTWMIPTSELRRITTPKLPVRLVKRQPVALPNAADEAARCRELLKHR